MPLVARQQILQQRDAQTLRAGVAGQRPYVLGQTRPPEWIPRFEIIGRQIQLGILAEQVHHRAGVQAHLLPHAANLVGKNNLRGVECITGVFHHLRGGPVYHHGSLAEER